MNLKIKMDLFINKSVIYKFKIIKIIGHMDLIKKENIDISGK